MEQVKEVPVEVMILHETIKQSRLLGQILEQLEILNENMANQSADPDDEPEMFATLNGPRTTL